MAAVHIGVYPGTFDPLTNGHLDIIRRALRICDRLIVGVATNPGKSPLFTLPERIEMVEYEVARINAENGDGTAEVRTFDGLLMHFVEDCDAAMIIRGLRAVSDFDYEFQMAGMNSRLNPKIEMVYLMASEHQQFIAARLVREIAALGGDIRSFVPTHVADALEGKFA
jgi:pantetheine-phosphate adenylyltransferase